MALFQPSNIIPSTFAGVGNGTVASADNVAISWQVNGNSVMTAFEIRFYDIGSDGQLSETASISKTPTSFYPTDSHGNPTFFSYKPNQTWGSLLATFVDGYEYAMQITQYWQENGIEKSVTQFSTSKFITRTKPTLTIYLPEGKQLYADIRGTYAQAQGDSIAWVRWQFAVGTVADGIFTPTKILDDTGEIYTSQLDYTYQGLVSNETYGALLTVETENGVQVTSNEGVWQYFTVHLNNSLAVPSGNISCNNRDYYLIESNTLEYAPSITYPTIMGTADGPYEFISTQQTYGNDGEYLGQVYIPQRTTLTWNTVGNGAMSFAPPYTIGFKTTSNRNGTLLQINGGAIKIVLEDSSAVGFKQMSVYENNILKGSYLYDDYPPVKMAYFIESDKIIGVNYYSEGDYDYGMPTVSIDLPTITSIQLFGEQTVDWLWVAEGNVPIASVPLGYDQPSWAWEHSLPFHQSYMLATFDYGLDLTLEGGNCITAIPEIHGNFYVVENGNSRRMLLNYRQGYVQIRDYGWKAGRQYVYKNIVMDSDEGTYATQEISAGGNAVCRNQPYYLLIEATADSQPYVNPDTFHVLHTWRFGNNISAGSVSNNNQPNWLTNFTGYDLKQPTTQKGKSGTLQALLSNATEGNYADTTEQMESLYYASFSANPFFLKDMKGNIYMVSISAPIVQTINTKSSSLEVSVSIPWKEIGDATGVSLIQIPSDEGWGNTSQN